MNTENKIIITCAISYIILVLIPPIIIWPIDSVYELITGSQFQDAVIGSWGMLTYFIFWLGFPIILLVTFAIYYVIKKLTPSKSVILSVVGIIVFGYGKYALMYS